MTLLRFVVLIGAFLLSGCNTDVSDDETTTPDNARGGAAGANVTVGPTTALPMVIPDPPRNPTSMEKVALGRLLFFDPVLSGNRDLSCASCHDPAFAYADGKTVSLGTGNVPVKRNSPTVLDTAFNGLTLTNAHPDPAQAPLFWDSRARSLENQARAPVRALDEMRGAAFDEAQIFPEVSRRLATIPSYVTAFEAAFGPDSISEDTIVEAIAAFERTLVTGPSAFDRWLDRLRAGDPAPTADFGEAAIRGAALFVGKADCVRCHSGPLLSDGEFHMIGVPSRDGAGSTDRGRLEGVERLKADRFNAAGAHSDAPEGAQAKVTRATVVDPDAWGRFRTPSLRSAAATPPYMHQGQLATLEEVVRFYDTLEGATSLDHHGERMLEPLGLSEQEREDLVAFLRAVQGSTTGETDTSSKSGVTPATPAKSSEKPASGTSRATKSGA